MDAKNETPAESAQGKGGQVGWYRQGRVIADSHGIMVCKIDAKVEFPDIMGDVIVEAVNSHAALLAQRDALRKALDEAHGDMTLLLTGRCPRDLVDEIYTRFSTRIVELEAAALRAAGGEALALAEGSAEG